MNVVPAHIVCLVVLGALSVSCQLYNGPVDCAFSNWSKFGPSDWPGQVIRTREIIREARNGGADCTGPTTEYRNVTDLQTPSLSKFLSLFIPGDRQKVALGGLLGRRQVPQHYTRTRDIALVVDTSVLTSAIPLYKSLISNLVGSVCGDVGRAQSDIMFTLITYDSRNVQVIHTFNGEQSKTAIQTAVLGIQPSNDGTAPSNLKLAMYVASNELSTYNSGTRRYNLAHKDVLLFVNYRSLCQSGADLANRHLKINGRVYVVVLGHSGDGTEPPTDWCLRKYASEQFDFHFLWVKSYDDLKDFASWTLDITALNNPCENAPTEPLRKV